MKRETFAGGGDKEVVAEAERLEIKDKAPLILVEVLLDAKVLTQLKQHRNLLLRVGFHFNLPYWKRKLCWLLEIFLFDMLWFSFCLLRLDCLQFCHENTKAQKYLLGGIEQLVGNVHKEELLPKVPHILKALYDLDIVDEEVLLDWDKKVCLNLEMHILKI